MKTRIFWLASVTILSVLLFSGTVFAEGEEPPAPPDEPAAVEGQSALMETPPAKPEQVESPAELPAVEEEPAAEVAAAVEETPVAAELAGPLFEEKSIEAAAAAEDSLPEIEEIPAPVEQPVLVDATGEPMDMASQESAQVLTTADPYFKVGIVTYRFSEAMDYCVAPFDLAHCFDGDTAYAVDDAIQDAIDYIGQFGTMPTDGKVYVEKDTYNHSVTINTSTYANLANLKGLIGLADSGIFPTINGNVTVNHTISGFTLSGFTINGYVAIQNNTGALLLQDLDVTNSTADGINVSNHSGNITMKNVKSHGNTSGNSAHLDNTAAGNVTVSDSIFNNNYYSGLYIQTHGTTSINNVIANGNRYRGILLNGNLGVTIKNTIANDNVNNEGIYLRFLSGSLTMENITVSGNGADGIDAQLDTPVNVTIKNLVANGNNFNGLLLKTLGTVTITNSQTNNSIYNNGLSIETSGKVTLNSIRSSDNGENGLFVQGIVLTESGAPGMTGMASPALVTISSPANAAQSNVFDGNGQNGIHIITDKPVTISNFSASGNTGYHGVLLKGFKYYQLNPDGVTYTELEKFVGATTISASIPNFYNKANDNYDSGFQVDSSGTVKMDRMLANGNDYRGIEINTFGSITVSNTKANANSAEAVKLFNKDASKAMPVSVTNVETSDNTGIKGRGLDIESRGLVKVTTLKSLNNSELGLNINNTAGGLGTAGLTLTNLTLNDNGGAGAELFSHGIVNLKAVTANDNGGNGVMVENESSTKAGIILASVRADGNNGEGFSLYTTWGVVIKDASASENAKTVGDAIFEGTVQDYYNSSLGVDAWYFTPTSSTDVTVRMEAGGKDPGGNELLAAYLVPYFDIYDNSDTLISITPLTCGTDGGRAYCEFTFSATASEIYHVLASSTGSDGFYRLAVNDSTPFDDDAELYWAHGLDISATNSVAVSGTNTFNNNSTDGLVMWLDGTGASNISVSNVTADGNGVSGMLLYNIRGTGNVTISGNNETLNNGWEGLFVNTNGTANVTNVDASFNGQTEDTDGVAIEADGVNKTVTLAHITALENSEFGVNITAYGSISLSNLRANANNNSGIHLENCVSGMGGCAGGGNVLMSGFNEANHNGQSGLDIITAGTITLGNLETSNNEYGMMIYAYGVNKAVTLNYVTANKNDGDAIFISSRGLTTLNTVRALLSYDGAYIDSNGYAIVVKLSSFMANDQWGLAYKYYNPITYPLFHFTSLGNVLLGNAIDLHVIP